MVVWLPSQSKRSGLLSPEEAETSSINAPSGKISPALKKVLVPFDAPLALIVSLMFKISSRRGGRFLHKQKRPDRLAEPNTLPVTAILGQTALEMQSFVQEHFGRNKSENNITLI
jgi:hypothetical protein